MTSEEMRQKNTGSIDWAAINGVSDEYEPEPDGEDDVQVDEEEQFGQDNFDADNRVTDRGYDDEEEQNAIHVE